MSIADQSSANERNQGGEGSRSGNQGSAAVQAVPRRRGWRLEVGIFIRKIVNRRVVNEWQFPPRRRLHVSQHSGSGEPVLQQASALPARQTGAPIEGGSQPLALRSTATADDSDDDGSTSEETSFEAGFYVQSTVPPEYKDPPSG